eukprot:12935530-Prorocentrum_lima.AAC.1
MRKAKGRKLNREKAKAIREDKNQMIEEKAHKVQEAWNKGEIAEAWKQIKGLRPYNPEKTP